MGVKVSSAKSLISQFAILTALVLWMLPALAQTVAIQHTVEADGHPMALWEKSVAQPKGHILLHHGRTWSSIPDFDLQVSGEDLSLMDGFNDSWATASGLSMRGGYGETPRDSSRLEYARPGRTGSLDCAWIGCSARNADETTHVWGWSYGSMVAQLTAQRFPQAVASVTLFGYPTDPDAQIPQSISQS